MSAHGRSRLVVTLFAALLAAPTSSCHPRDEAAFTPPPPLATLRLTVDGPRFLDAAGRTVLLRGVNAGGRAKFPPFFPFAFAESGQPTHASAPTFERAAGEYLDRIVAWGHDVVRLPFTWEALEPTRGAYDDVFLERYARLAELAGARGLRVLVDFHQDVFASPYCGDGFPLWTLPQPIPPRPASCASWFTGYLGPDTPTAQAFDRFWRGEDGLQEAFAAMWRRVAARLWRVDAVIGFEIINEPGVGSMEEGAWSRDVLMPFYERIARAIREVAPGGLAPHLGSWGDAPIFYDATGLSAVSLQTALPPPTMPGFVFAPHYYSAAVFLGGLTPPEPEAIAAALGAWRRAGDEWHVPVLVGEFGSPMNSPDAALAIRYNFDGLDRHALHGTLWEYSSTADDWNGEGFSITKGGGAEWPAAAEAVRVYPRALAGDLVRFRYDAAARAATLVFRATAGGTSELAAPRRLYADGPAVRLAGAPARAVTRDGIVYVRADRAGELTVELTPR